MKEKNENNNSMLFVGIALVGVLALGGLFLFRSMNPMNKIMVDENPKIVYQESNDSGKEEMMMEGKEKNIVTTAVEAGSFKTLVAAVQAAGLEKTLAEGGTFTVLAPTDEAFAKLPEGTVESLLKDKERLTSILTYHVFNGKVDSNQVVNLTSAKTLNGQEVKVMVDNGKVMINDATVIQTDIDAGNGLIHVIDTVLLPS